MGIAAAVGSSENTHGSPANRTLEKGSLDRHLAPVSTPASTSTSRLRYVGS